MTGLRGQIAAGTDRPHSVFCDAPCRAAPRPRWPPARTVIATLASLLAAETDLHTAVDYANRPGGIVVGSARRW